MALSGGSSHWLRRLLWWDLLNCFINLGLRNITCIVHICIHISPIIIDYGRRLWININVPVDNLFLLLSLINIFNGLVFNKNSISASEDFPVDRIPKPVTKVFTTITQEDTLF